VRVRTATAALGGGCGGGGGMEQRHGEAPHNPGNSSSSSAGVTVMVKLPSGISQNPEGDVSDGAGWLFLYMRLSTCCICFTGHQPLPLTFVSWRSSGKDDGEVNTCGTGSRTGADWTFDSDVLLLF
jgi:hypothetical protein